MKKEIWKVTYHTYWEHYGANPTTKDFETKEAAEKAVAEYMAYNGYEDGCYATISSSYKIIITKEDEEKRKIRAERRQRPYDYRKKAYAWGVYTNWAGEKEPFFIEINDKGEKEIFFPKDHTKYYLCDHVDYFKRFMGALNKGFCLSKGESLKILGGWIKTLPESLQEIDCVTVQFATRYEAGIVDLPDVIDEELPW